VSASASVSVNGRQRLFWALGIGALAVVVYACFAASGVLTEHTRYNHFALLARAWLDGRLDLAAGAPGYAGNNDFAVFQGRTYVVFPPLPALFLVPFVALAGSAEAVPDGLVFVLLAGVAPVALFLALERLSDLGRSGLRRSANALLAVCFAFGSVYFFCAVQGTVWFAAHVVGSGFGALYLWSALGARRPLLSGVFLGLAFLSRAPLLFAAPLFVFELSRAGLPRRELAPALVRFSVPVAVALAVSFALNHARFGDGFEFGYRYLTIAWQARIERYGLFDYHYLAKNLGVMLTSLPWLDTGPAPFRINHHGLALWLTTPLYVLLVVRASRLRVEAGLALTALSVSLPSLFYQNTGWQQFGYRFSNDYAPFLFALLAVSGLELGRGFRALAGIGFLVNALGAFSFGRADYQRYYFTDPTQRIVYEPD
jgi:hypothetical protein